MTGLAGPFVAIVISPWVTSHLTPVSLKTSKRNTKTNIQIFIVNTSARWGRVWKKKKKKKSLLAMLRETTSAVSKLLPLPEDFLKKFLSLQIFRNNYTKINQ